jgi:hypothetical protein
MAERVRRIKQKRREKMGLPPLEEDASGADKEQGENLKRTRDTMYGTLRQTCFG